MDKKMEILQCNLSLLPLGIVDYNEIIQDCIQELSTSSLDITYGPMSTVIAGPEDIVFQTIQHLFQFATQRHPKIILQATFSNCCPKK
ncbi:MAG: YkoF family thiamine/hydroxymethylpyrimidine-binding protein [Caldisericia bacterium]|nr:YkoF family thiamine/hydroxymethylpyrimidine-binding protein [Caldisericia bacterium]MDD4615432.1 YkoF family thiamine/hydroxymethylpyrimidine-binding protein [Caldisericia bacterium]